MAGKEGESLPAIGIDLGTTYSCVGVWQHDRVEIIANDLGSRTTPSCVAFAGKQRLIGEASINQASINPSNTIYDAKRLIGRNFNDQVVQDDIKLWPFTVVAQAEANGTKKPMIVVNYNDEEKHFSAEEIWAMVLTKMKEVAESYLGTEVKNAVVTVPAYFNNEQRQATKDAGMIAGLNVLRIINEPTAAAIAYGLGKKLTGIDDDVGTKNVLVFDLGGGTFDVSLVVIGKDTFEVKAVGGDSHLGGGDFDKRLLSHFLAEFERKHGKSLNNNPKALGRLRSACEKAKRNLSATPETSVEIDCLFEGIDFSTTITRARFDKLNMDLFQDCLDVVDNCLKDAKVKKGEVNEIVLIGGSTRIPKVRQLLQEFFNGKELCKGINPDEAVAYGAASHAAVLAGVTGNKTYVLADVTPLSLGIRVTGDVMNFVVPRNTSIPSKKKSSSYHTTRDNQTSVPFGVYEGESGIISENNFLGEFLLEGIPPAPKGVAKFDVVFELDANGILTVSAEDIDTKNKNQITITNHSARPKKEIDRMIKEAQKYKAQDEAIAARNMLKNYVEEVKDKFMLCESRINLRAKRKLGDTIEETEEWLGWNDVFGKARMYTAKLEKLKKISEPAFKMIRQGPARSSSKKVKIETVVLE